MRVILFTGKGGTGKTTCAAATALQAANSGIKTLVISTDPAHSLADSFDIELGPEPTMIMPNLYAQELDIYYSMRKYWGNLRSVMLQMFKWQGIDKKLSEEMSALPGMEEASAFLWIEKHYEDKEYDLIVIDSAPTGETLTLLTLPQSTKWWTSRMFPVPKLAVRTFGPMFDITTGIPIAKGYEELQEILSKLEKVHKIFSNHEICSIRLVATPEKMVIQEARRALMYLQLYGFGVDSVIVNRVMPEIPENSFFKNYLEKQNVYLEEIASSFSPLPILKVSHFGEEVFGHEKLSKISQMIYQDNDLSATDVLFKGKTFEIYETAFGYNMEIPIPFAELSDIKVKVYSDELVVDIGNRRRNIFLPKFLRFYEMMGMDKNETGLILRFEHKR